jgi:hypothetical protein
VAARRWCRAEFPAGHLAQLLRIQLAPAIAGAVGLGGALLWQRARPAGAIRVRRLLALTVSLTALWSTGLLLSRIAWPIEVVPITLVAGALVVSGLRAGARAPTSPRVLGSAVLVALLAGPAGWSVATAQAVHRGADVYAGPGVTAVVTPAGISPGSTTGTALPTALAERVRAGAGGFDWPAAVVGRRAADLQLASGTPVYELGGYSGAEPFPTLAEFRSAVADSSVHYLVLAPGDPPPGSAADQVIRWAVGTAPEIRVGAWRIIDLAPGRESRPGPARELAGAPRLTDPGPATRSAAQCPSRPGC